MSKPMVTGYQGQLNVGIEAVIAISETKSAAVDLGGFTLCGIILPVMTGTALSFEVSDAIDGTFVPLKSTTSGTTLSYTTASSTYAAIDPKDFQGVRFLKVVSGSTELAARTLKLAVKGL